MIPALKAEIKKLTTIRSTYGWCLAALVLLIFVCFYVVGFKDLATRLAGPDHGTLLVAGGITQLTNTLSVFAGIIALLLITHEYRYNTIIHTIAAANSRNKVLAAKIGAILIFTFFYTIVFTAIGIGLIFAGAAAAHQSLPPQDISYLTFFAKSVYFCEGYALAALLFGTLIRNQVGAIAALFILPGTVESLLSLLLKKNSVYMPFTALSQVVQAPTLGATGRKLTHGARDLSNGSLTPAKGALVFLIYLVVVWIIAWYLFRHRDAT